MSSYNQRVDLIFMLCLNGLLSAQIRAKISEIKRFEVRYTMFKATVNWPRCRQPIEEGVPGISKEGDAKSLEVKYLKQV